MPNSQSHKKTRRRRRGTSVARRRKITPSHAYVVDGDRTTHILVPVDEYERLIQADMASSAISKLHDTSVEWVDADALGLELAGERIAAARRAKGVTQKELGAKLGIPQSQVSRIERNPDGTTVRTLKRIARALGVDVAALA